MKQRKLPFHAVTLRVLALVFMLLDHMWGTIVPGNLWMTCLGRLTFPIFAFQTAEGYEHTSNLKQYAKRLLLFGLISEIPFNLVLGGSWFYPFHQNAMFTMAIGLLGLHAMNQAWTATDLPGRLKGCLGMLGCVLLGAVTFVDYGAYGVMMILLFGLSRRVPAGKLFQLAGMILINVFLMEGQILLWGPLAIPLQAFAVLALPLIWLYNGEKGPRNRLIQYGSYLFYPVHLTILYLIWYFS